MLFKGAALGDERAYLTIKANPGGTQSVTTGWPVILANIAASFDGTQAVVGTGVGGTGNVWLGVAYKDLGANTYGLIQCWGANGSILLSNTGNSLTINLGDPLLPAPGGFFSGNPSTYAISGFKYIVATNVPAATSALTYMAGFIRCI